MMTGFSDSVLATRADSVGEPTADTALGTEVISAKSIRTRVLSLARTRL
jgi:hypothetical protein